MDTHSSSQLLTITAQAESKLIEEISQDDRNKTPDTKEFTSSIIGWILRGGVILSAVIILFGLILLLVQIGEQPGFEVEPLLWSPYILGLTH
ncbi:MAG TPA: hypothetical protein VNW73_14515, partial [Ktedonobacteraceae bacterium]|nr:hypothetical protein [Ktedonobacteraceae bacterium]